MKCSKWLAGIALLNCSLAVVAAGNKSCDNLSVCSAQPRKMAAEGKAGSMRQQTRDNSERRSVPAGEDGTNHPDHPARHSVNRPEQQKVATESLAKSQRFLAENSRKEGVVVLKSGLQYRVINQGSGRKPSPTDHITVHYEGRLMDGTLLDSSYRRNQPTTFQLNRVIAGWSEGIQKMPQGSVWELVIPPTLAYGAIGIPGMVGPNEVIIFKVELKDVCQGG